MNNDTKGRPWKDTTITVGRRVELLIAAMNLEEKVGQLMQLDGQGDFRATIDKFSPGSLLHINGRSADDAIDKAASTRLGIPLLLADDGIHGHSFWAGATIFPTQLALACSWDTKLMEDCARVTAREMRATGLKWTFSPVLCIARDTRWGRVGETFGEDPLLIGEFASAMIRGYQGSDISADECVLATAKHYAGYSETMGGRDASEADASRRKLNAWFLPPFERAAKAGCLAFMTGYQSIDGVPSTASRWLLTEVLREEWNWEGMLVTDWYNVGHLVHDQKIAANFEQAATIAVRAGNDLMMAVPEFYEGCLGAVKTGLLAESELNVPLRRILELKFRLGLFENPGKGSPEKLSSIIAHPDHRALNLRAARESLVLLKNDVVEGKELLPLDRSVPKKVAVVGPNADNPLAQLGDWSLGSGQMVGPSGPEHPRSAIVTVLDGLKALAPAGWTFVEPRLADIIVLVVGDDLEFIGEAKSTATLELQRGQKELSAEIAALKKPVISVLVQSKPQVLPEAVLQSEAIIELFNPGMQGGTACAEAIFGLLNPGGKLTISFPRHAGQLPVFYNQVRGQHGTRYADLDQDPVFAFGHGLSYTKFTFGEPVANKTKLKIGEVLRVEVELRNEGPRDGVEIVQVYIEDVVTSATWARIELKAFRRVELARGESSKVAFDLDTSSFSIVNAEGDRIVEPGVFRAHTGNSSRPSDLKSIEFELVTTEAATPSHRT